MMNKFAVPQKYCIEKSIIKFEAQILVVFVTQLVHFILFITSASSHKTNEKIWSKENYKQFYCVRTSVQRSSAYLHATSRQNKSQYNRIFFCYSKLSSSSLSSLSLFGVLNGDFRSKIRMHTLALKLLSCSIQFNLTSC